MMGEFTSLRGSGRQTHKYYLNFNRLTHNADMGIIVIEN